MEILFSKATLLSPQLLLWIIKINTWHFPSFLLSTSRNSQGNKTPFCLLKEPSGNVFPEQVDLVEGKWDVSKYFLSCWFLEKIVQVTERLKKKTFHLSSFKKKFNKGITEIHKIFSKVDNINACFYFWYCLDDRSGGRSGSSKNTNSEERDGKGFVTQRIINVCNGLLGKADEVKTVGSFK